MNKAAQYLSIVMILLLTALGVKAQKANHSSDEKGVFIGKPDILPSFKGGIVGWNKFLKRNLNTDTPIQNDAADGCYISEVSFLVDEKGEISDIKLKKGGKYGTGKEAIRMFKITPPWLPAMVKGKAVKYRTIQEVRFMVSSE